MTPEEQAELEELGQGVTADALVNTFNSVVTEDEWCSLAKWIAEAIERKQQVARAQVFREVAETCREVREKERQRGDKFKDAESTYEGERKQGCVIKYHEHYSVAWAAHCLAAHFKALAEKESST